MTDSTLAVTLAIFFNSLNATGLCVPGTAHIFQKFQSCFLCQFVFCLSSTGFTWAIYVVLEKKSLTGTVLYANNKLPVLRRPQHFHGVFP